MTSMTRCPQCGAKMREERPACGRCRAPLAAPATSVVAAELAAPAESTRLSAVTIVAVIGVIVMAAGVPFFWGGGDDAPTSVTPRADPFAARRQSTNEAPSTVTSSPVQTPGFMESHDEGAVAYAGGNYANASERYQAAIAKNPDDAESFSNLGQVLVREGKAEEALPYFDRAIAIIPQRWAYRFNRARALGIVGRTADAVAGYRDAQQLFPDDYATAFNLGLALHKLGDEAAAVDAFQKAIQLDPNDASFRMALGISLERLQRPRDAAAAYEAYLRLSPSAPDATAVRARITQLTQAPAAETPGT
jgi:Flp pilus assembly protein TadD